MPRQVLDTKKGLPIMLSLLYLEMASRINFPMAGVNLPQHFMARPTGLPAPCGSPSSNL